jgi:cytochrome c peroxidase
MHSTSMRAARRAIFTAILTAAAGNAPADTAGARPDEGPVAEHADQGILYDLVAAGKIGEAFELAFDMGDELFETRFNSFDGVGANVGQNQRFTRVPRADLAGPGEWAQHLPARTTGPNAENCNACHNLPFDDGAGLASSNVHRDPGHTGEMASFIARNTPHLFAPGALQVLAEEMTAALHAIRAEASETACATRRPQTRTLMAKGVNFGEIGARPNGIPCEAIVDTSAVSGVEASLVVKPFQWKGSIASLREFNRDAAHNELGLQGRELAGDGADGDFDGVAEELTIGDLTAISIYLAAQPRPTSLSELSQLGLIAPLDPAQSQAIADGRSAFHDIGCTACHRPQLVLDRNVYSEPSQSEHHRDGIFPGGQDPLAELVDPAFAVSFDLTRDQPDNIVALPGGGEYRMGALETDAQGRGIVRLYGDLKRHRMGAALAEPIDEVGSGAATFMTAELWGVGSTAPYLHDGRATTLTEAILAHGGEASAARDNFAAQPQLTRDNVIAFLENLVLFKIEEEE